MNTDHLREFTYLAETLNFGITAKHFFISQSVLSKHISALEEDLDVVLFDRDRRHVELTELGKLFYKDSVTVLNDFDNALAHLAVAKNHGPLAIRVGYLRNAAKPFLDAFIDCMEAEYPDVTLVMKCYEYGELIHAHRSHMLDVVLSLDLDPEAESLCNFDYVYTDKMYAVVGKGHPFAARSEGISKSELVGCNLLLPRKTDYPGVMEFIASFIPRDCRESNRSYYSDVDTMIMRLKHGEKVAFTSGHNISEFGKEVVFVPIVDADTSYTISARWFKDADPNLAAVVSSAVSACRKAMARWSDGYVAPEAQ